MAELESKVTIDGFTFEYSNNDNCKFYECRGRICYDDEHDEVPQPELWEAALKLEEQLKEAGYDADAEHSEKGWVEVNIWN